MDAEIKERWVGLLRKGAYEQGAGALRGDPDTDYCVLGVLCQMYCEDLDITWETMLRVDLEGDYPEEGSVTQYYDEDVLPPHVKEWAGLEDVDPILGGTPITVLNDGRSNLTGKSTVQAHTFKQLADLIEKWL